MNVPPDSPTDAEVLALIREHWGISLDTVRYFPEGFGAHHWQGLRHEEPYVMITLDSVTARRSADDLENAYAAAEELGDSGYRYAVAPIRSRTGRRTVPIQSELLSVAWWKHGETPTRRRAESHTMSLMFAYVLETLHESPIPTSLQAWEPGFENGFVEELAAQTQDQWDSGPLGNDARRLIIESMPRIEQVVNRYLELAARAIDNRDRWVPTHGEPHFANQVWSATEMFLVDWETFRFAPPERDLLSLHERVRARFEPDPEMIELFELEWTLLEIDDYAEWFSQPHDGNDDDIKALAKLREELSRT